MNAREKVLTEVAEQVVAGASKKRLLRAPWLIAVDGVDGVGKTTFADHLAELFRTEGREVMRVSMDGFHQPSEVRYRQGRTSPEGFYRDSFDYSAFRSRVVVPLKPGGSRMVRTAAFDHTTDRPVNPKAVRVADSTIVLVDGIFLLRKKLTDVWDSSVFLRASFESTVARLADRDGSPADPAHPANRRYVEGQRLYLARKPERRATVVVDHDDPENPFVVQV